MNIDERLDRPTQRHEARAPMVELLSRNVSEVLVNELAEGTARPLHGAEIHERRIN